MLKAIFSIKTNLSYTRPDFHDLLLRNEKFIVFTNI